MRIGRYELEGVLRAGAHGLVHRATLIGPGSFRLPVALKVLYDAGDGLVREARLGGLLRHPNLVDVYEVGEADGTWFAAMELCADGTLAARPPLPPSAVVEVGLQVCAALSYAHEALGLVHLDLKPANLLLAGDRVKVGDLGVSRATGFDAGRLGGTPPYMAPEQRRGPVDARTDVYGLGRVLEALARGAAVAPTGAPTVLAETAPRALPGGLTAVLQRCTSPDPDHRYPTMQAVAEALSALHLTGPSLSESLGLTPTPQGPASQRQLEEPFVGRTRELARLADALRDGPVVLRAPGGLGKTRLALEMLRRHGPRSTFCALEAAASAADVLAVFAQELSCPLDEAAVAARLQEGHLVVVDTVEHLDDDAVALLAALTAHASAASWLLTSQVRLPFGCDIELGPLDLEDAIALLVHTANARGSDVDPNDSALAALARRLDGIPLALRLAAGRIGVLSPAEVLERMSLSMLRSSETGRQATVRQALDWSWRLLTPAEQAAFAQLSVFRGGATPELAEAALTLPPDAPWVLDVLETLLDRGMLRERDGRLDFWGAQRAYAAHRLEASGRRDDAERAHGRALADLVATSAIHLAHAFQGERDNLLVAGWRALARGDLDVAVATCHGACARLSSTGAAALSLELAEAVLAYPLGGDDHAQILNDAFRAALTAGQLDHAIDLGVRARTAAAGTRHEAVATFLTGLQARYRRRVDEAREAFLAALTGADANLAATITMQLGVLAAETGQPDEARRWWTETAARLAALGIRPGRVKNNLGVLALEVGRVDEALGHLREALQINRDDGNRYSEAMSIANLGRALGMQGRLADALTHHEEALAIYRELGDARGETNELANLGATALSLGDLDRAEAALSASQAMAPAVYVKARVSARVGLAEVHLARGDLDAARHWVELGLQDARETGFARYEGLARRVLGEIALAEDDAAGAISELEAAASLHQRIEAADLVARDQRLLGVASARSGDHDAADRAWAEAARVYAELDDEDALTALAEDRGRWPRPHDGS
jgi:tetratricopeptide (TPR) repeat protein